VNATGNAALAANNAAPPNAILVKLFMMISRTQGAPETDFSLNKKPCQSSSNFLDLIDKGLVQSFSNLPKLRFLDHTRLRDAQMFFGSCAEPEL
jgi:hypothetical protein